MSAWPTSTPSGVKAVAVNGVKPSIATVRNHSYPISRSTFYYTNGTPTGEAKSFLDFTLSPAGQKIVQEVGFAPQISRLILVGTR